MLEVVVKLLFVARGSDYVNHSSRISIPQELFGVGENHTGVIMTSTLYTRSRPLHFLQRNNHNSTPVVRPDIRQYYLSYSHQKVGSSLNTQSNASQHRLFIKYGAKHLVP